MKFYRLIALVSLLGGLSLLSMVRAHSADGAAGARPPQAVSVLAPEHLAGARTNPTGPQIGTFSITGVVTDESGVALGGATISLSGTTNAGTTTASDGSYSFAGLTGGGKYTVTPTRANYTFAPQSQSF